MTIYLHCGGHKTASSFMKMFLRKNKALFEAQKIAVHLDQFRDRQVKAEDIIDLAQQDYQNNYQKIIISEDANIIGLMPGIFQAGDRNFFQPNSIRQFANLIAQVKSQYPIKFLLCIRRQDTYLESCYKFRKTHGAKYSLEEFLEQVQQLNVSWYNLVNRVALSIGQDNCLLIPYELLQESQQKFITSFFKSIIQLDSDHIIIPPPNNQGASELMMAMINYFDRDFPDISDQHRQNILAIIKKYQAKNNNHTSLLSEQVKQSIMQKYVTENQKLFLEYLADFPSNYYDLVQESQPNKHNIFSPQLLTTSH